MSLYGLLIFLVSTGLAAALPSRVIPESFSISNVQLNAVVKDSYIVVLKPEKNKALVNLHLAWASNLNMKARKRSGTTAAPLTEDPADSNPGIRQTYNIGPLVSYFGVFDNATIAEVPLHWRFCVCPLFSC